jgi:hypothetical protein
MITRSKEELVLEVLQLIKEQSNERNATLFSVLLSKNITHLGDDVDGEFFSEEQYEWVKPGGMIYAKATYADPHNDGVILKSFINETDRIFQVGGMIYTDTTAYDYLLPALIDPKQDLHPHYIELLTADAFANELLKLDEPEAKVVN